MIDGSSIAEYDRDGVVCVRSAFDARWIDVLEDGMTQHLGDPTRRARVWDSDEQGRTMRWDSMAWRRIPQYERFIRDSGAAALAGTVMGSDAVNFYFDAVFVRSAGSQFETPWHQDEPYWTVDGFDTCTIWMPLVPVRAENALAFVPGSHRWGEAYEHYDFGRLNPDAKDDVDHSDFSHAADRPVPDIAADPERYGVVSWDMEPGDCAVFNSRIMHGGSGRLPDNTELRVFTSKWLGDNVRIAFRDVGMDPDFSELMTAHGLGPGDRPGTELLPRLWERPIASGGQRP